MDYVNIKFMYRYYVLNYWVAVFHLWCVGMPMILSPYQILHAKTL